MATSDDLRTLGIRGTLAVTAAAAAYLLYSNRNSITGSMDSASKKRKYQAGEDYEDPKVLSTTLYQDLKAIGFAEGKSQKEIHALIETIKNTGNPLDDKKLDTENLISLLTKLPTKSKTRKALTNKLLDALWDTLQHPPLSYMGGDTKFSTPNADPVVKSGDLGGISSLDPSVIEYDDPDGVRIRQSVPEHPAGIFQYRTPDGSYNNILSPHLGRAGTPYAKSVMSRKKLHGVRPDPGLLFDLLMKRDDKNFKDNPAGLSSMLFYHATIIIHDIFRTNRLDSNISDTSSYLDLAPLYGSSLQDQLEIRTMRGGMLKPDTFHEKRLLGQPPGVNVMLVMYNRFHNYVADILLKINEGGRFTLPDTKTKEEKSKALAKQDNDLFNTARLIVGGLYINISLHDYLRGITNTHASDSTWTLDPRVEIGKQFLSDGTPRGVGNQVSVEFNLLYRFHSAISKRDELWLNDFFEHMYPDRKGSLEDLSIQDLMVGLQKFSESIPKDPSQRNFGSIKRGADGKFNDADLVKILQESIEDPAGSFGARMVPKALRMVEILGILQARKWQCASLNEFREFFGLKRHEKMTDINPNPDIARILEDLYTSPDMVELYPGLFIEDAKPMMATGCGICPPYSVGRAILSDAVTLVRSDRFNTIDFTAGNLTNWGMAEIDYDVETLGGSMLYKLIQRALPGWFPYNSLHVMQPMFTKNRNREIAQKIGTYKWYTEADPAAPRLVSVLMKQSAISKILKDQKKFRVPWLPAIKDLRPEEYIKKNGRIIDWYMLAGDGPDNAANRKMMGEVMASVPNLKKAISTFVSENGKQLLKDSNFEMRPGLNQIDVIRDIAIPLAASVLGDLFYMDLCSPENPQGTLGTSDLYKHLLSIRVWGANNNDPGLAWNRRRWAAEGVQVICKSSEELVKTVQAELRGRGLLEMVASVFYPKWRPRSASLKEGSLRSCGHRIVQEMLARKETPERIVDNAWLNAFGGVGVPVTAFAEVLQFFLLPDNMGLWGQVQDLAGKDNDKSDALLRKYVLEAQRITSHQRDMRICAETTVIDGKTYQAGQAIVLMVAEAGRDPDAVPDPLTFKLDRPESAISHFGLGPHGCFGREIALAYLTGLIKIVAGLKCLRPAPGDMGVLKWIQVGSERCYLSDNWSYLTFDATTWKVHFEGPGKGVYKAPATQALPKSEGSLIQVENVLRRQKTEYVVEVEKMEYVMEMDKSEVRTVTQEFTSSSSVEFGHSHSHGHGHGHSKWK